MIILVVPQDDSQLPPRRGGVLHMKITTIAIAAALSLIAGQAISQEAFKNKFLDNLANAFVVAARCKEWTVNPSMVAPAMDFFHIKTQDISPGGADWPTFEKLVLAAQENSNQLDDTEMCVAAAGMFGPSGVVARDLMIPKEP